MINEKPLTFVGISGIVFPALLVMMFPEGTAIYSIANILLTLFSGFLFIVTVLSACGQKEVLKVEQSYEIPLFEAFASNFGDECAIVWKKTNELVEIPGNDGKLTYTDAHRILNDYLKQNPDKIWGIQIVPSVEIVTHMYPVKETELKPLINELEEVSAIEADEDQATTDEIEEISPIKEIDVIPFENIDEIHPAEDVKTKAYDEEDEDIFQVDETEEISIWDDPEAFSTEEDSEIKIETDMIEETSTAEDTNDLSITNSTEDVTPIKEIVDLQVEQYEEISAIEYKEDLVTTSEAQDLSISEVLEGSPVEKDTETKAKGELLSNIPDPYIILSKTKEISSVKETEDLPLIEEISTTKDLEEVPSEKDTETKAKGELLSNIPKPYIILGTAENLDKTNDNYKLKENLEEE